MHSRFFVKPAALLFATVLAAPGVSAKDLKPTSFRAVYKMMVDAEEISPVPACAAAGSVAFEDARTDDLIGHRSHEKKPELKLPIAIAGDVLAWVKSGFDELARRAVLPSGSAGQPNIALRLASLWVDESVYRNAEYDARIVLDVTVTASDGVPTCWSGRVDGFAENYGRAGKEVNYQETVNHALDKAVLQLFGSTDFRKALCSCGG